MSFALRTLKSSWERWGRISINIRAREFPSRRQRYKYAVFEHYHTAPRTCASNWKQDSFTYKICQEDKTGLLLVNLEWWSLIFSKKAVGLLWTLRLHVLNKSICSGLKFRTKSQRCAGGELHKNGWFWISRMGGWFSVFEMRWKHFVWRRTTKAGN